MNNICVPIPRFAAEQSAQVSVKIAEQTTNFNYRVESFNWVSEEQMAGMESAVRIESLKGNIERYDKKWELIQIYSPGPRDEFIQVLFREKVN